MFELQALAETPPFASVMRAAQARGTPRKNHLLAALPSADYARLRPHLEPVALPPGWAVHRAGERESHIYFITSGIVSRFYLMESGASAEFAVTGSEGVIGVASFLGGERTTSGAVVLCAGRAYRLKADLLETRSCRSAPLARLLLLYAQAMIAQAGQIAVCNRYHSLEQQLCRWVLSCVDRLPSATVWTTHALIAQMLGVRRESVTETVGKLQSLGLVSCGRGRITVLDRDGLEAHGCECYGVIKREYDRLLPHD